MNKQSYEDLNYSILDNINIFIKYVSYYVIFIGFIMVFQLFVKYQFFTSNISDLLLLTIVATAQAFFIIYAICVLVLPISYMFFYMITILELNWHLKSNIFSLRLISNKEKLERCFELNQIKYKIKDLKQQKSIKFLIVIFFLVFCLMIYTLCKKVQMYSIDIVLLVTFSILMDLGILGVIFFKVRDIIRLVVLLCCFIFIFSISVFLEHNFGGFLFEDILTSVSVIQKPQHLKLDLDCYILNSDKLSHLKINNNYIKANIESHIFPQVKSEVNILNKQYIVLDLNYSQKESQEYYKYINLNDKKILIDEKELQSVDLSNCKLISPS